MLRRIALVATPWILVVLLWWGIAVSGLINPSLVPTPPKVAERFWQLLTTGKLPIDILMPAQRVFFGVTLGIVVAVPVGFVLGWYRNVRMFIDPLLNFFRALPPIALIPLVIVYFGIGEPAKIIVLKGLIGDRDDAGVGGELVGLVVLGEAALGNLTTFGHFRERRCL